MTAKQKIFCEEYLIDLNATQAAIRAGYSPKAAKTISLIHKALCVLISKDIKETYRKKAAFLLIQIYVPKWREILEQTDESVISRHDVRYTKWLSNIKRRDGNKCSRCGETENLEIHHILPWSAFPEHRIDLANGITLCNVCHANMHIHERQLILNRSKARRR